MIGFFDVGLVPHSLLFSGDKDMTKQNSNLNDRPIASASRGVTLVELLVVITILTIIFAVMIPRLKAVNEDRNIREAARVVASAFSKASSRAINDGSAGLLIVPNPNFQQATFDNFGMEGVDQPYFAGTRIFQMRRLPAYIGDAEEALAWTVDVDSTTVPNAPPPNSVVVDSPFEHQQALEGQDSTNDRLIIQPNDEISFNGGSYRYRIVAVGVNKEDGFKLDLTLDTTGPAPLPSLGEARPVDHGGDSGVPFVIHRQPRRLESSLVELPEGYFIDLRYSGSLVPGVAPSDPMTCVLNQNQSDEFLAGSGPEGVELQFDASGGISRMFFVDTELLPPVGSAPPGTEQIKSLQPIGALNWLVTEYDPNAIGGDGNYISRQDAPIFSPSNKWVTVDHLTGSVHVASGAVPAGNVDVDGDGKVTVVDQILESRAIANNRQSAAQ